MVSQYGALVESVYNGHPWDHAEWLLNRGGLLIEFTAPLGTMLSTIYLTPPCSKSILLSMCRT